MTASAGRGPAAAREVAAPQEERRHPAAVSALSHLEPRAPELARLKAAVGCDAADELDAPVAGVDDRSDRQAFRPVERPEARAPRLPDEHLARARADDDGPAEDGQRDAADRMAYAYSNTLRVTAEATAAALTDALTGLGNRRALLAELEAELAEPPATHSAVLVLFDLDGFKDYNDTFGHPAGDALLVRLGGRLDRAVAGRGSAYRLGGDEFCALLRFDPNRVGDDVDRAVAALHERGEGFDVGSSHGTVILPAEAPDSARALQLADQRLYAQKGVRRRQATTRQVRDVLLQMISERTPELRHHIDDVALLAQGVGRRLGLRAHELHELVRAAELHDIGKMAIPDEILTKPGPLDAPEWEFMRQHTIVGERMLGVAPALGGVARLVRWSHERVDGGGYPDGLAGEEIPLGARIITVCDAFHAMTSDRPYRRAVPADEAVAELLRHCGTQFDADVVAAFQAELAAPSHERSTILRARSEDRALSVSAN